MSNIHIHIDQCEEEEKTHNQTFLLLIFVFRCLNIKNKFKYILNKQIIILNNVVNYPWLIYDPEIGVQNIHINNIRDMITLWYPISITNNKLIGENNWLIISYWVNKKKIN